MQTNSEDEVVKSGSFTQSLYKTHVERFRLNEKATSEAPGSVLIASSDPSIPFVCTALDHSELAFKCSSCQILPATQSTLSLFASQRYQRVTSFSTVNSHQHL